MLTTEVIQKLRDYTHRNVNSDTKIVDFVCEVVIGSYRLAYMLILTYNKCFVGRLINRSYC